MTHTIRLLASAEVRANLDGLAELLFDAVESGASVNFVWPMTMDKALGWWLATLDSCDAGQRLVFVAETPDGRLDGTVQLILAPQENQAHRADLAKMLVHRRARRQGLGEALMRAAEVHAASIGRDLLTLDTYTASDGDRLYARLGWTPLGIIPGFATRNEGDRREAATFYYKQL